MFYRNNIPMMISGYVSKGGVSLDRTPSGMDLAELTIVSIPEFYDTESNTVVKGDPSYLPVMAWNQLAINIAYRFKAGDHVLANGDMITQLFATVDENGNETQEVRQVLSISDIGASVRYSHLRDEGNVLIDHAAELEAEKAAEAAAEAERENGGDNE